jgi:hypothetical protein
MGAYWIPARTGDEALGGEKYTKFYAQIEFKNAVSRLHGTGRFLRNSFVFRVIS